MTDAREKMDGIDDCVAFDHRTVLETCEAKMTAIFCQRIAPFKTRNVPAGQRIVEYFVSPDLSRALHDPSVVRGSMTRCVAEVKEYSISHIVDEFTVGSCMLSAEVAADRLSSKMLEQDPRRVSLAFAGDWIRMAFRTELRTVEVPLRPMTWYGRAWACVLRFLRLYKQKTVAKSIWVNIVDAWTCVAFVPMYSEG